MRVGVQSDVGFVETDVPVMPHAEDLEINGMGG
jgi:hypothetical protein